MYIEKVIAISRAGSLAKCRGAQLTGAEFFEVTPHIREF
jgi:hypothetical protein